MGIRVIGDLIINYFEHWLFSALGDPIVWKTLSVLLESVDLYDDDDPSPEVEHLLNVNILRLLFAVLRLDK